MTILSPPDSKTIPQTLRVVVNLSPRRAFSSLTSTLLRHNLLSASQPRSANNASIDSRDNFDQLDLSTAQSVQANEMGLGGHLVDPAKLFALQQKRTVQIVAVAFASMSILITTVTIYWFFMMRRNFRRHLVLLLVLGDLFRSLWYLVFAARSLDLHAQISSGSNFCQSNGWLLQASTEATDMAIFLMSLHMSLQIFNANSKIFGPDGLYRYRYAVFALYVAIPCVDASLAFIQGPNGYISQGPFCTLPIRPFWYRLALSWIPRYLNTIYILFVAVRIYLHVGTGFKVFARQNDHRSSSVSGPTSPDTIGPATPGRNGTVDGKKDPSTSDSVPLQDSLFDNESPDYFAQPTTDSVHVPSYTSWPPTLNVPPHQTDGARSTTAPNSRRSSHVVFHGDSLPASDLPPTPHKSRLGSISTITSFRSDGPIDLSHQPALAPIVESNTESQDHPSARLESADTPLAKRRRAIQRQLRLLFIYPVVYILMWAIPFALHAMYYSDYYANHPVFVLAVLSCVCQCSMGTVDCTIFCWREKPWRHIPGSDGTFIGSFKFWRFYDQNRAWNTPAPSRVPTGAPSPAQVEADQPRRPALFSAFRSVSHSSLRSAHRKTFSASSDRAARDAELAAQRLALERQDRENRPPPPSRTGSVSVRPELARPISEWWDRRLSEAMLDRPPNEKGEFDV